MIVKRFGCMAIHNKALYKCIIHSFISHRIITILKLFSKHYRYSPLCGWALTHNFSITVFVSKDALIIIFKGQLRFFYEQAGQI